MREKQSYWHSEEAGVYCGAMREGKQCPEVQTGEKHREDRCLQDPTRKVSGRAKEAGTEVVRATQSGAGLHKPSLEVLRFRF